MTKVKYYYDPETLSYRPIQVTHKLRISNFILFILSSFLFGLISLFILLNSTWLSTPNEIYQTRELENYKIQFDILNKKLNQVEAVLGNIEQRDNTLYRLYFEASPIPEEQRRAGFGGIDRYKALEGYDNSELIKNTTERLDVLIKQTVVQSRSLDEIEKLASNRAELIKAIPSIQPIKNEDLRRIASGFGKRRDPFTKLWRQHNGIDFTAKKGTPVYATGDGIIKRADNRSSGYGKHIRIDHGHGYVSLYAHLNGYNVRRGQRVKRGEIIGFVGNTGRSAGAHLHYEIFKDKKHIDPINFYYGNLSPEEYEKLIEQAKMENQSWD
ncbi:MAG: peptidase M23 [Flavobacteriales bacterium MED-G22]|nr:M23 family metallopeptidase [Flavobacteriaceae bacterium]PDH43597.1 MAG: peptidase M23 [Flavobacteriales bacterium MED-G22]